MGSDRALTENVDAQKAYENEQEAIKRLMTELKSRLSGHAKRQRKQPRNWGYVGDLRHLRTELEALTKGVQR